MDTRHPLAECWHPFYVDWLMDRAENDFVVHGIKQYPKGLAIECKWQDSSGSDRFSPDTPSQPSG